MSRIFRLNGASREHPDVESWIELHTSEVGLLARAWLEVMRACGDDVLVVLHDGYPTACIGSAAFAYVGAFRAHANVGFFHGAELPDPDGLLQGTGKHMRHVKLGGGRDVDPEALAALVATAYQDMRRRLDEAGDGPPGTDS